MAIGIGELMKSIQVTTDEAAAYVKYFDYLRRKGLKRSWAHFKVRFFELSVSYMGEGYYSALMKVDETVKFAELEEVEGYKWLKGWIFQRDLYGQFWVIVDGDTDEFEEFRRQYKEIKRAVS